MLKVLFTVVNFNNLHFFKAIETGIPASIVDKKQITSICFEKKVPDLHYSNFSNTT